MISQEESEVASSSTYTGILAGASGVAVGVVAGALARFGVFGGELPWTGATLSPRFGVSEVIVDLKPSKSAFSSFHVVLGLSVVAVSHCCAESSSELSWPEESSLSSLGYTRRIAQGGELHAYWAEGRVEIALTMRKQDFAREFGCYCRVLLSRAIDGSVEALWEIKIMQKDF
jgi:hypothetical protein